MHTANIVLVHMYHGIYRTYVHVSAKGAATVSQHYRVPVFSLL